MKEFKPRIGSKLTKEQAQIYGEKIQELILTNGGKLTTEQILKEAKKKNCVLHDFFTWDDEEAGKKYRLQQARQLMEGIVEVVIIEGKLSDQRSFFNVNCQETNSKVYVTLTQATEKEEYRTQLITKIINNLNNTIVLLSMFKNHK